MRVFGGRRTSGKARRRSEVERWPQRLRESVISHRARFIAFMAFVALAALTGGSARADVPLLMILRPAAILFTAYALFIATASQLRAVAGLLAVVLAFMVLTLLQLVPLPTSMLEHLAPREWPDRASALLGMESLSRPLSLDPNRTWNTFFALFIPLGAICLVAVQADRTRQLVLPSLIAIAGFSMIIGCAQAIGGDGLHFYRITHTGYPVGLFANKNHQSIVLLWLMVSFAWFASKRGLRRFSPITVVGAMVAVVLAVFPLLILTGSRSGLLLSIPALALSAWLIFNSPAMVAVRRKAGRKRSLLVGGIAATIALPLAFVVAVLALSQRQTALSRLFELDAADDRRWFSLPVMLDMARDALPLGTGFGTFESVFNLYEPGSALTSRYVNQAHNDALQLVIEGGIPALIIALTGLAWLARRVWRRFHEGGIHARGDAVFFGGSFAIWLMASLVDYPLRTPLAALLFASLTAMLCYPSTASRTTPGRNAIEADRVS